MVSSNPPISSLPVGTSLCYLLTSTIGYLVPEYASWHAAVRPYDFYQTPLLLLSFHHTPATSRERERGTVLCDACVAAVIRIAHCVCVVVCFSGHKFIAFIDAVATLLPLSFAANTELDCFADDWRSPPQRLQLVPPDDKQITRPT